MSNLRQQIAASESVRMKFLTGKPFSEADVRMELSPSTDLRTQLDEAMQLVLALTAANQKLREQIENRPSPRPHGGTALDFEGEIEFLKQLDAERSHR